jgi:phosphoribosylformylglycinamidine cyclo-ligase
MLFVGYSFVYTSRFTVEHSNLSSSKLDYQSAGVDINAGNELVNRIKPIVKATHRPEVLGQLGGFAGMFALAQQQYQNPILVASTDGVGTKLKLAIAQAQHHSIGIDLVAMCVNDLIVCGAQPLFFLDYYATSKLEVDTAEAVITGIAAGCQQANCALIGGETAEMPGMYANNDYDLAGFSVGIVEQQQIIDGSKIQSGDVIIGIASSGPHANGYSLIRKLLEVKQISLQQAFGKHTLGEVLLAPTKIYVRAIQAVLQACTIHGLVHITGGGFLENIPRILPEHSKAIVQIDRWPTPEIFTWMQQQADLSDQEMWRTFNNGIGMMLILPATQATQALDILHQAGESAWQIGHIATSAQIQPSVECHV